MLRTENIHFSIGHKKILHGISADFVPGKLNMILGPNGSGKSTFLKIFSGETRHFTGHVEYEKRNITSLDYPALAKFRAVMSQQTELSFPLTAEEVVMMGRYPHFDFNPSRKDSEICNQVMELLSLSTFKTRNYLTLSGGEKQRVQYARVLAQIWEPTGNGNRYLFLDEPLNSLDINYQQEFLQIARKFATEDTVVVAVMHDINLAIQFADNMLFFREGKIVAGGAPKVIINEKLLEEVFQVRSTVINNPVSGNPLVIFDNSMS